MFTWKQKVLQKNKTFMKPFIRLKDTKISFLIVIIIERKIKL